jgi:Ni,Fe-hydrogenase maturation factor
MYETLAIGLGNLDRGDDGAAFHVVNRLRESLGLRALGEEEDGLGDPAPPRAVFVRQLVPELTAEIGGFSRLVVIDAHVASLAQPLQFERLEPLPPWTAFSHVFSPAALLWLTRTVSGSSPEAFLISLRGHDFSPGRRLSAETAGLIAGAADLAGALFQTHTTHNPHSRR